MKIKDGTSLKLKICGVGRKHANLLKLRMCLVSKVTLELARFFRRVNFFDISSIKIFNSLG